MSNPNFSTSDDGPKPEPRLYPLDALLSEAINQATEAHEARRTGQPLGPITGLKTLDQKIGGALPRDAVTMILGNSGSGKTGLAGQFAAHCGCPAVYLTTEMSPVELLRRHTARETKTFLGRLKSGELSPAEFGQLVNQTARNLSSLTIADGTTAYASVSYLAEVMKVAKGDAKHAVLVVDSLHTWTRGCGTGASEYEALGQHLMALQRLAKFVTCAVVVICEQNRASIKEGKESGGGNVNSGAGNRFIEYSADLMLDLESKKPDGAGETPIRLTITKNRHGAKDIVIPLEFNGALQRFREAAKNG